MAEDHQRRIRAWVASEVIPHEPDLRAWLRRIVAEGEIEDIVQETYCRIAGLDRIGHIRNGRAYVFQSARSIVIDRVRRSRVVSFEAVAEIDSMNVSFDEISPERVVAGRRELARVQALIQALPDRCRRIFELRKVQDLPQRQVAELLGLPETTVENDVAKGLRLILQALADGDAKAERALGELGRDPAARDIAREHARDGRTRER